MRSWGVRDTPSRDRLESHVPALEGRTVVTVDPGIWAGEVYGLSRRALTGESLAVGLGVSDPAELAAYAHAADAFSEDAMLAYWSKLARTLIEADHRPVLFTNGSEEDEAFLDRLIAQLQTLGVTPGRLPRAVTPAALADQFRGLDALVSHRLHANIIAFSAGIPSVALVWDDKVRAFAQVAGREHWTLSAGANARQTADLVIEAGRVGVDLDRRDLLKARALADVETMLRKVESLAA
jgi:polysaccharide pyruvyl transferase WcaK-like protein